jgi:hypothetical protein
VYAAPLAELSISVSAVVPRAPRQPAMVPPSVAKRKMSAGPPKFVNGAPLLLKATPVGSP